MPTLREILLDRSLCGRYNSTYVQYIGTKIQKGSGMMRSKSKAKERRTEIADGLFRCIATRGYANTTVRDIAREAGVGLGLITHYFESKDEILYTLADHIFEQYQENFIRFFESHSDKPPKELLKLGIKFMFVDIAGDRNLIAVFQELINLSRHDKDLHISLRKLYKRYRETVAGFLGECARGSNVSDVEIKKLATFLVSASEGVSEQWSLDPRGNKLSEMAAIANRFVDCYIGRYNE